MRVGSPILICRINANALSTRKLYELFLSALIFIYNEQVQTCTLIQNINQVSHLAFQ